MGAEIGAGAAPVFRAENETTRKQLDKYKRQNK